MVRKPGVFIPERGDLVWIDFSPQRGHEQAGRRPALILSAKVYNAKTRLALMCPLTTHLKGYPFEVVVATAEIHGVILTDQVRVLDWGERHAQFAGRVSTNVIAEVQEKLLALITLE